MRFLLLFFLLGGPLFGQLTWEHHIIELAATPKDEFVEGHFLFKNSGNYPVTILKTESTCGCTTAKLEKKVYAPGDSGEVVEHYKIGWNRGLHDTGVTVVTDDPTAPKTLLGMRVMIEKTAEIAPEVLWWKMGSPPSPQEATIKIVRSTPLDLITAETETPGWSVKLIPVTPGWEYRVQVTPTDLSRSPNNQGQSAVIVIKPAPGRLNPPPLRIRARVK